jgi:LPXTG-motif cell wall-anchored protein
MGRKAQFYGGLFVAVLAALGLLALAGQEVGSGQGWQVPAAIGFLFLVLAILLVVKNRRR